MEIISWDNLVIQVDTLGAELKSLKKKDNAFEWMWQGDPHWWGRTSPVLFPAVGKSNHNYVRIEGTSYAMPQHGFARDMKFLLTERTENSLVFELHSSPETLHYFPFDFRLKIGYIIQNNTLTVQYTVENTGIHPFHFQIGAHPGFNLPVPQLDRYQVRFDKDENSNRHLLKDGLFSGETATLLTGSDVLPLHKDLFVKDAVVFKDLVSRKAVLEDTKSSYSLTMDFEDFPYFGIWAKKDFEDFICLEPWYGCADTVQFEGEAADKESTVLLAVNEQRVFSWKITV